MTNKSAKAISPQHIEAGIRKYEGVENARLTAICKGAGLNYTAHIFKDGRVLIVLPNGMGGLLYENEEAAYESIEFGL